MRPAPEEIATHELTVHGTLPPELNGRYFSSGHDPGRRSRGTGVRLTGGRASWEVTDGLETTGAHAFDGRLTGSVTAHPKEDPVTGDLHFFSCSPVAPHLTYYVASADGDAVHAEVIDGAGPSLMHAFAITTEHAVFLDFPRIGVLPRTRPGDITWFEVGQAALLHVANSYVDPQGRVVVEGPRYDRSAWESCTYGPTPTAGPTFHRWILDPATGKATDAPLDDLTIEFPSINEDHTGCPNRYSYAVAFPGAGLDSYATVKFDTQTGRRQLFNHTGMPGEAVFAPAAGGRNEDDGYLLTIVSDPKANASRLLVLDATNLDSTPIATVLLPRRASTGIHGHWLADDSLACLRRP